MNFEKLLERLKEKNTTGAIALYSVIEHHLKEMKAKINKDKSQYELYLFIDGILWGMFGAGMIDQVEELELRNELHQYL